MDNELSLVKEELEKLKGEITDENSNRKSLLLKLSELINIIIVRMELLEREFMKLN